jgi:bacterioferritin-associated ferredoxin
MYVCVCNAVTERDICCAVAEGCHSLRELRQQLDFGSCCGRCFVYTRGVLQETLQAQAPHRTADQSQRAAA